MQITIFSERYQVLPKSTSYDNILKLINTRTLELRRFFHVLILLFKSFIEQGPTYIKDFFKLRTINYRQIKPCTVYLSLSTIVGICYCALHMIVYSLLYLGNFHYFQYFVITRAYCKRICLMLLGVMWINNLSIYLSISQVRNAKPICYCCLACLVYKVGVKQFFFNLFPSCANCI